MSGKIDLNLFLEQHKQYIESVSAPSPAGICVKLRQGASSNPEAFTRLVKDFYEIHGEYIGYRPDGTGDAFLIKATPTQLTQHADTIIDLVRGMCSLVEKRESINGYIVATPKVDVINDLQKLSEMNLLLKAIGAVWDPTMQSFIISIPQQSASTIVYGETEKSLQADSGNTVDIELKRLKAHYVNTLTSNQILESVRSLAKLGVKPDAIRDGTGMPKSTLYKILARVRVDTQGVGGDSQQSMPEATSD